MSDLTDSKTEKVAQIIKRIHQSEIKKLLVVGCGSGLEAAILAQRFDAEVSGIDLENNFDARAAQIAELQTGDAMNLAFSDESFDFVFSYHALEHIENPQKALREMRRVLKPASGFWIGTPNKSRIVGYIGGKNASLAEKWRWNVMDYKARLRGKFENRFGAHAGFTSGELYQMLAEVFPLVEERTREYFSTVYARRQNVLRLIERSGFSRFIYPSVYFSGRK
jgi:ubiquinone/menaquinone biosynthesis C-methylase UbiE